MAKRRKASKTSRSRRSSVSYRPDTWGIRFDSLTFLLFIVFVLLASIWFFSHTMGMTFY